MTGIDSNMQDDSMVENSGDYQSALYRSIEDTWHRECQIDKSKERRIKNKDKILWDH